MFSSFLAAKATSSNTAPQPTTQQPTTATQPVEIIGSPKLWDWLQQLQISLAFTTYQTNRLFLVGSKSNGRLAVNERLFDKPMGLYATDNSLYMSTRYQIWHFDNLLASGENYNGCDRLYIPRTAYTTGDINVHDVVAIDPAQPPLSKGEQELLPPLPGEKKDPVPPPY